jgi:ATP-dependent Zn protease
MAYSQVAIYGMNEKVGLVSYPNEEGAFNKPYSNETARVIDDEVRKMVQLAYERTIALLEDKKTLVTALAETLLRKDVSFHLTMQATLWCCCCCCFVVAALLLLPCCCFTAAQQAAMVLLSH